MMFLGFSFYFSVFGCTANSVEKTNDSASVEKSVVLSTLQHRLTWDAEGVTQSPGESLIFETDQGYRVTLQRGHLVSYSFRLYPCPEAAAGLLSWLIPAAHAGHSDFDVPSNWQSPWVEDLLALETVVRDPIAMDDQRYCEGIYSVARADQHTENRPENPDMINWSLWVVGQYEKEGQSGDFEFQTAIPSEAYWQIAATGSGEHGVVTVHRALANLFDGVVFESDSSERSARTLLLNLTRHATLTMELNP